MRTITMAAVLALVATLPAPAQDSAQETPKVRIEVVTLPGGQDAALRVVEGCDQEGEPEVRKVELEKALKAAEGTRLEYEFASAHCSSYDSLAFDELAGSTFLGARHSGVWVEGSGEGTPNRVHRVIRKEIK